MTIISLCKHRADFGNDPAAGETEAVVEKQKGTVPTFFFLYCETKAVFLIPSLSPLPSRPPHRLVFSVIVLTINLLKNLLKMVGFF